MIDHKLCKTGDSYLPRWPCPVCAQGTLEFDKNRTSFWPAAGVVPGIEEGEVEHWDTYGVFSTTLKCSNPACLQGVAVLGDYNEHANGDYSNMRTWHTYEVKDIHPAIRLIDIPPELTPKPIVKALERSFALFWRDPEACAMAIRTAIEGVADHLGQPARQGRRFINLHKRLDKLAPNHPHIVEAAKAIKDLGNDGAHGAGVERDKLLAAYELLEIDLPKIFNNDAERRQKLISRIRS